MKFIERFRIIAAIAAFTLVGIATISPLAASAQSTSGVMVQAYICPQDYAGPDWALECDPLEGVDASVYIDASEYGFTESTNEHGTVNFDIEGGGPFVIELGVPGDFADFTSLCGEVQATEPSPVEGGNTNRMILDIQPGKDYYCTFYVSPVDAQGEVGGVPVEELPSTGAGLIEENSGLTTVALLLGAVVLLAGLGLLTAREDLFERS